MGENDDIEVTLEDPAEVIVELGDDGTAPALRQTPAQQQRAAPPPTAADDAAATLTQSLKDSEAARTAAVATAEAERRRAEQASDALRRERAEKETLRERAESSELVNVTTGIAATKSEQVSAKADYARAMEAGDFSAAGDAQERMAIAAARMAQLESKKTDIESRPAATEMSGAVEPQGTPFERYVSGFKPQAQAWLRAHPECVPSEFGGDAVKNAQMMQGHYAARTKGIPEGTPEYFKTVEEHTGHRAPVSAAADTTPAGEEPVPQRRQPAAPPRSAQPSAPPSRELPGAPPRANSVRLSPEQQEAAKISWPNKPEKEAFALYAQNLVALRKEGLLGRTSH